jgi:hypothetical protein
MSLNLRAHARGISIDALQWRMSNFRLGILVLILSIHLGGCSTHLGYVPHDVYAPSLWPFESAATQSQWIPTYQEVKNWGFNVADGYDSRATANRQAIYFGALTAVAGASALVGLAAFAPGSPVIIGLPIGTTFLSGAMTIYNNEQKAVIYGSASQTIRDLLIRSDYRYVNRKRDEDVSAEAVCLHSEVSAVMRKVNNHITLLDPKNVADRLKAVAYSIEAKQAMAAQKQDFAQQAAAAAKKFPDNSDLQKAAEEAAAEATNATEEASKVQAENTVQSLSAEANDFSDLNVLPPKCGLVATENSLRTSVSTPPIIPRTLVK